MRFFKAEFTNLQTTNLPTPASDPPSPFPQETNFL